MTGKKNLIYRDHEGIEHTISYENIRRAIRDLRPRRKHGTKIKKKGSCTLRGTCSITTEEKVALHPRQEREIADALRISILRHDWKLVIKLTKLLCKRGTVLYGPTIMKSVLLILLNHQFTLKRQIFDFIRDCTEYESLEDVEKFFEVLLMLRSEPLPPLGVGKYIRKGSSYKIIDEPMFCNV